MDTGEIKSTLDQPAPKTNDSAPLWPMVMEDLYEAEYVYPPPPSLLVLVHNDMKERHETGMKRYGTALQAHNGRKPLIDAYQELLDATVYLKQAIQECPEDEVGDTEWLRRSYYDTMDLVISMRAMIRDNLGE